MLRQRFVGILPLAACTLLAPALALAASSTTAKGFGHVHALLVHPQNETLLVGTHHGLFRSQDAGASWERVMPKGDVPGRDFMTLAMHPQRYAEIYVGGHDLGIMCSEDVG